MFEPKGKRVQQLSDDTEVKESNELPSLAITTGYISDANPENPYKDGARRLYVHFVDEDDTKKFPLIPERNKPIEITLKMPSGKYFISRLLYAPLPSGDPKSLGYHISMTPKDVEYMLERRMVDALSAEGLSAGMKIDILVQRDQTNHLLLKFFYAVQQEQKAINIPLPETELDTLD